MFSRSFIWPSIIAALILFSAGTAFALIDPSLLVQDKAGILDTQSEAQIAALINTVESKTTAEIAVMTLPNLGGRPVEDVALENLRSLGIGKKDKNNGLLILVALEEHKIRIEVGYGLEGDIPDSLAERISRTVIAPSFKEGKYSEGIIKGIQVIQAKLDPTGSGYSDLLPPDTKKQNSLIGLVVEFIFNYIYFFGLFALVVAHFLSRSKAWWHGGILGVILSLVVIVVAGLTAGLIALPVLVLLGLLIDYILSRMGPNKLDHISSWFIGGGRGGRGGGGFGGGGFGGGSGGGGGGGSSW